MVSTTNNEKSAIQNQMLSYISEALERADGKYKCHVNPDEKWVKYGILRVLHKHDSGREFFQDMRMDSLGELDIVRQDFQEGLKSKRRLRHLTSINDHYLEPRAQHSWKQRDGGFHELLDSFHIYAADGHFHAASTHEERDEKGRKHAIGHLYALNMRNRDVSHLALSSDGTRKKPHDLGTLKKMDIDALRQNAKKGQKVLYLWDRACIDFEWWMKCKHNKGVYFVTRSKENMKKEVIGDVAIKHDCAENSGVIADQIIMAGGAEAIRMITYQDLETGTEYEFITNLHGSIPPGVIVQLYRMRWDIEKVFNDFKSKLEETKAWSKSLTGKRMQAQFMILVYNILLRLRDTVEQEGVIDPSLDRQRERRWKATLETYAIAEQRVPKWLEKLRRVTQIGVRFIRWARSLFLRESSWSQAVSLLDGEYSRK